MDRSELLTCLIQQPHAIQTAESALLEIEDTRRRLVLQLESHEGDLLLKGQIDGKNAELRTAQLRDLTASQRALLVELEGRAATAKLTLHRKQNEFASLRALARLLGGNE